ncbi:PfkB family carbohydrate kinase [Nocardiopsis aegyptia]|uniref:RfaE bifunctional protein nucleotidyltransferase chain/domain n=1 Tax=Nocardiopsis aegyptia TaxID=220378 RepID=A0A7Z0JA52_9ACTN|nr:PfkB family carbohydrate kinase [Nocardiopsis aegyptia]NYJ34065.1 rfaE bifunctional protein nucleotidyltransferase chain/domain [Nocardiopsis aegyptia]
MSAAQGPVVVVGDALLDVDLRGTSHRNCPDAQAPVVEEAVSWHRPGGAALAALCAHGATDREVLLVTGLGSDDAATTLAEALGPDITLVGLPLMRRTPTKTRIQADGRTIARLDTPCGCTEEHTAAAASAVADALRSASAVLVSDYGHILTRQRPVRTALREAAARVPVVWDPHPRGLGPVPGTRLTTPNAAEAGIEARDATAAPRRAAELARAWGADSVAVTLGEHGAAWSDGRHGTVLVSGEPVDRPTDVCGAGDAFAAACAVALSEGADPVTAVRAGVRAASAFVAQGGAAARSARSPEAPDPPVTSFTPTAFGAVPRAGRGGRRVVATGGCFDVLHAGHVDLLRRARALGDRLVVLLNSDSSVRALKGPDRPIVGERDRARVLSELACVDEVEVFTEPTPVAALGALRPDVWVKGGDYDVERLPETPVVRAHGGRVVTLPLVPGRSTTALLTRVRARDPDGLAAS